MNDFEAIFGWILNDFEWSYFYAIIQITLLWFKFIMKKFNIENTKIKALLDSIKIRIQTSWEISQLLTMRAIFENFNYFSAFEITSQLAFTVPGEKKAAFCAYFDML